MFRKEVNSMKDQNLLKDYPNEKKCFVMRENGVRHSLMCMNYKKAKKFFKPPYDARELRNREDINEKILEEVDCYKAVFNWYSLADFVDEYVNHYDGEKIHTFMFERVS